MAGNSTPATLPETRPVPPDARPGLPDTRPDFPVPRPWGNAPAMAVTAAIMVGAISAWSPIFSLILRDLGASDLEISAAIGIWAALGAVVQYSAGRLADKLGRVPIIAYSMQIAGVGLILAGLMPSWLPFAVVYTLYATGNAATGPVFTLVVGESVAPEQRGRAFGYIEAAIGASLIIGPLAGAWLLPRIAAKGLLIISGILVAGAATARWALLRETRPEATGSKPFAFRQVFQGRLGLILLAVVLWNVVLAMTMWGPFLALHAGDAMSLGKETINILFAAGSAVSVIGGLWAGRLVSRFGPNRMFIIGGLGLGAAVLLWALQRSIVGITVGFVLMGGFMMLAMVASDTFRVSAVEESMRGSALGSIGMVTGFATALATPLAGYLKQLSPMAPFWVSLAAAGGLALAVMELTRRDAATP